MKDDKIKKSRIVDYAGKSIARSDNQSVREWYVANVSNIPNLIDRSKDILETASKTNKDVNTLFGL